MNLNNQIIRVINKKLNFFKLMCLSIITCIKEYKFIKIN